MIGVLDSGLGGLSVLGALVRELPRADFVYHADTAHVPYGNKDEAFIEARVLEVGAALAARGCGAVVVACNTATVAAVNALRRAHPAIAIVGVEPGVKPAAADTRTGRIAVLATEATARSARLRALIEAHARGVEVFVEACPGWATHVETLALDDPALAADVRRHVAPLLARGVDRLVLGCTHFSFLAPHIAQVAGTRAALVDVADAVARQTARVAPELAAGGGTLTLLASAHPARLRAALPGLGLGALAERLVGTRDA